MFYNDGVDEGYVSSTDGVDWSTETTLLAQGVPYRAALYCSGSTIYYVDPECDSGGGVYYGWGTLGADGAITWEVGSSFSTPYGLLRGFSTVLDSAGGWWVSFGDYSGPYGADVEVWHCANPSSCSWSQSAELAALDYGYTPYSDLVALTAGKMAVVLVDGSNAIGNLWGYTYSGSSWSSYATTPGEYEQYAGSCVAIGDTTECAASVPGTAIDYVALSYDNNAPTWSPPLQLVACSVCYASMSLDGASGLAATFTTSGSTVGFVASSDSGGTWSSEVDFSTSETDPAWVSSPYSINGNVQAVWTDGTSAPFDIRFAPGQGTGGGGSCTSGPQFVSYSIANASGYLVSGDVGFQQPYQIQVSIRNPASIACTFEVQVSEKGAAQYYGDIGWNWPPVIGSILSTLGVPDQWDANPQCQSGGSGVWVNDSLGCGLSEGLTLQPGQTGTLSYSFANRWAWIPPWDWQYLMGSAVWSTISGIGGNIGKIDKALEALQSGRKDLGTYQSYFGLFTAPGATLPYEGFEFAIASVSPGAPVLSSGAVPETILTMANIPKMTSYLLSVLLSFPGGDATDAGIAGLAACETIIGCLLGAGAIGVQAGLILAQNGEYVAATDPSPDYAQVVHPVPPTLLNGTQIVQLPAFGSLPANMKAALETTMAVVEYDNATSISLDRYAGAELAGSQTYEELQLQAAAGYAQERDELMAALDGQLSTIPLALETLNSSSMQVVTSYLLRNGLPPIEQQILSGFGMSSSIGAVTDGLLMATETNTTLPSWLSGIEEWQAVMLVQTDSILNQVAPPGQGVLASGGFVNKNLRPLPTDSFGNSMVTVDTHGGVVKSTDPRVVTELANVTNTGTIALGSFKVNVTIPPGWEVEPSGRAIRVYYESAGGKQVEITAGSQVSALGGGIVAVAVPNFNATKAGAPLVQGASVVVTIDLVYTLDGSAVNAADYPVTCPGFVAVSAWEGGSYTGSSASQEGSVLFVAYLSPQ